MTTSYDWITGGNTTISHKKKIDGGGEGVIHAMWHSERNVTFARKLVPRRSVDASIVQNEIRAIRKLCDGTHENIITVFEHGELLDSPYFFIDMELCDFNLNDYIKAISLAGRVDDYPAALKELRVWKVMKQIAAGLCFVHEHNEVHRDLKPQNVLYCVKNKTWKLADFGITSEGTGVTVVSTEWSKGTPGYRAPELLKELASYNNKVDIWALGCILFELVTSTRCFTSDIAVNEHYRSGSSLSVPCDESYPTGSKATITSLVLEMLQFDPTSRPSAAILHEKFTSYSQRCSNRASTVTFSPSVHPVEDTGVKPKPKLPEGWPEILKETLSWTEPGTGELPVFQEDTVASLDDSDSDNWDTSMTVLETVVNRPSTRLATISYDLEQKNLSVKLWNTVPVEQLSEWKDTIPNGTSLSDITRPTFDVDGKFFAVYSHSNIHVVEALSAITVRTISIKEFKTDGSPTPFLAKGIAIAPNGKRAAAWMTLEGDGKEVRFSVKMFPQRVNKIQPVDVIRTKGFSDVSMGYLANGRRLLTIGRRGGIGVSGWAQRLICHCFDVNSHTLLREWQMTGDDGYVDTRISYITFASQPCLIFRGHYLSNAETGLWIISPEGLSLASTRGSRMVHGTVTGGVVVLQKDELVRLWTGTDAPKEVGRLSCEELPPLLEVKGLAVTENYITMVTDDEQVKLFRKL